MAVETGAGFLAIAIVPYHSSIWVRLKRSSWCAYVLLYARFTHVVCALNVHTDDRNDQLCPVMWPNLGEVVIAWREITSWLRQSRLSWPNVNHLKRLGYGSDVSGIYFSEALLAMIAGLIHKAKLGFSLLNICVQMVAWVLTNLSNWSCMGVTTQPIHTHLNFETLCFR